MRFLTVLSALAVVGMAAARAVDSEFNEDMAFVRRACDCDGVAACCAYDCDMDATCCNDVCMIKFPGCYNAC
ncbi:hypothetical protein FQN54_004982 [Arachnomyces sp. PD_36]|nr:hypothetical protein FQN54_004982 [Arachnomyces sp. PD_36]